jgi:hypothetical protein
MRCVGSLPRTSDTADLGDAGRRVSSSSARDISSAVHRRGDSPCSKRVPQVGGRKLLQVPAGTSALRKTVNCTIEREGESSLTFSVPDVLGALVLKGAVYKSDPRDRNRHLDDAALLA